jgi:hypothetical protein
MSYAVVWSEGEEPVYAGNLELANRFLLLAGTAPEARESSRKLPYAELAGVSVERRPELRLDGRPTLLLARRGGPGLRIASVEGGGALHELVDLLTAKCGNGSAV